MNCLRFLEAREVADTLSGVAQLLSTHGGDASRGINLATGKAAKAAVDATSTSLRQAHESHLIALNRQQNSKEATLIKLIAKNEQR